MIVTGRITLRIGLIVVAAVILQAAFFSFLSVLGATPNLVPVVVVCLGLLGGAVIGAVCGFAAGLLTDSVLLQTLGVSSLVLLSVGYLAGRYRESVEVIGRTTPALLAGALTLLAAAGFAAVQLMLGVETSVSVAFLREVVVQGALGALLALAVYPLVRRLLAPALIDYSPAPRTPLRRRLRLRRRSPRRAAPSARQGGEHAIRPARRRAPARRRPVHGGRA